MAAGDEDPWLKPPPAAAATAPADDGDDADAARGDDDGDKEQQDLVARLPEDLLADVLGRLALRWLAACRSVCKAWRAAVDDGGLLRADLLPLSLAGIFVYFDMHMFPEFFSRPSSTTGAARAFSLDFLPSAAAAVASRSWIGYFRDYADHEFDVHDHCNGLLLLHKYVVNPATRQWNTLPRCPSKQVTGMESYREHLVFDPTLSPHYEVFMIPYLGVHKNDVDLSMEESEWPPSSWKMHVFSSRSGCWEERIFIREGDAVGTVSEMRERWWRDTAVYWGGALYVHCKGDFAIRISLSDNKYHVIQLPKGVREKDYMDIDIRRSEKGVYLALLDECWLRVWILNETCGQTNWILKHDKDLKPILARHRFDRRAHASWILSDINYDLYLSSRSSEDNKKAIVEEELEWNSDNDDVVENKNMVEDCYLEGNKKALAEEKFQYYDKIDLLGFHPYKEIVFLSESKETGLAYQLNNSKVEYLGNILPKDYTYFKCLSNESEWINSSFPYTPCWIEGLPRNN